MTTTSTTETYPDGLLEQLRSITPHRSLTPTEAQYIAERQATLLVNELHLPGPALPHVLLADLPFLTVAQHASFRASGLSTYTGRGWLILLKRDEPKVRQRFHWLTNSNTFLMLRSLLGSIPHWVIAVRMTARSASATTSPAACSCPSA